MNNPRPKAHQQVMTTPSKSSVQRVGVTAPAKPSVGSPGTTKIPSSTVNSPGIKGVKGC